MPLTHKNRHGAHQEVHIGAFKLNEIGLVSGSAQRHRDDETEFPNDWSYLSKASAPAVGVPCVGVERVWDAENSRAVYTYSYQGAQNDFTFDDKHIVFELDMTMSEESIETHPNFGKIKLKYGWQVNKRRFTEYVPGASALGKLAGANVVAGVRSPLFGVDSWLVVGATLNITYLRGAVPPSVLSGIGTIGTPRGLGAFQLPSGPGKRTWLKLAPLIRKKGNVVQITERWMMSGPRGWNKDIYGSDQLGEGGDTFDQKVADLAAQLAGTA